MESSSETGELATALRIVRGSPDHKVLERLAIDVGETGDGDDAATNMGCVVDIESTGLDHNRHRIIELAIRRFKYDVNGVITRVDRPFTWLEDPGEPLEPVISRITGLHDPDLVGQRIDDGLANTLLKSCHVIIAHNASLDRKFVERRLPEIAGRPWACSCREIDWLARGMDGRGLGFMLWQHGWWNGAHRAAADVDSTIQLLRHRSADGVTALRELVDTAGSPGWLVSAVGANFAVKDLLKARGYAWDVEGSVWRREVSDRDRMAEEFWLASNVYSDDARPKAFGPSFERIDWFTRHG